MKKDLRSGSVERWLLVLILMLQLIIAWGIFAVRSETDEAAASVTEKSDASTFDRNPFAGVNRLRSVRQDPFETMDAMLTDSLRSMARLHSALRVDDGWDSLTVSPTMDMRSSDSDYIVSLSIPGVSSSNVNVSLNGRVLTVHAVSAVGDGSHSSGVRSFERRILLPGSIGDAGDVRADMTNGFLRVFVPKGDRDDLPRVRVRLF